MLQTKTKHERLEARISPEQKDLFKRAAEIQHKTLTDFVLAAAYDNAKKVIQEHEVMELTARDQKIFVDALLNPPQPNAKLRKAAKRYLTAMAVSV